MSSTTLQKTRTSLDWKVWFQWILARLVHFIMVHKQLVGIKQRAERLALADLSSSGEGRAAGIAAG